MAANSKAFCNTQINDIEFAFPPNHGRYDENDASNREEASRQMLCMPLHVCSLLFPHHFIFDQIWVKP